MIKKMHKGIYGFMYAERKYKIQLDIIKNINNTPIEKCYTLFKF